MISLSARAEEALSRREGEEDAPPRGGVLAGSRPRSVDVDGHSGGVAALAERGLGGLVFVADLAAVLAGVVGVKALADEVGFDTPAKKTAAFGLVLLALFLNAGLYRSRLSLSVLDDVPALSGRWLAAVALSVLGQILWSRAVWQDYVIDWHFMWGAVTTGVVALVLRAVSYTVVRRLRQSELVSHPTLILGAGSVGHHVAEILRHHPEYGLRPIGFVDAAPRFVDGGSGLPVVGGPSDLHRLLVDYQVRDLVVAFSSIRESEMVGVIRTCDRLRCELFVVPRLFELQHVVDEMDAAWGLPLVRLRRATYRSRAWRMKRLVDVTFSASMLVLLAPVMLVIAVAVRVSGGPGVLFRQERVGVDGRTFQVLKFRSMRPADPTESASRWSIVGDDRLSPIGRFLRKTSLDELPQLYNVLRGDMSLVGPRPERPHFVQEFRDRYPSYAARHRVPSGLTGLAQVHGLRGDTSIADRARFDNYYIENWSLWLDVKILIRTVTSLLKGS